MLIGTLMRIATITTFLALVLGAAACGDKTASLDDIEKLKTEACACKDKACAEKLEKKVDEMLTDATIKKHGEKGMSLAFDIVACIEGAKAGMPGLGAGSE